MTKFYYKTAGSSDVWNAGFLEDEDHAAASARLDNIYGVWRDKDGNQTNSQHVRVAFIDKDEFDALEKERGQELTHNPETFKNDQAD